MNVILFGSVAREEAGKDSDIDLFIDVIDESDTLEREIRKNLDDFYASAKFKSYWRLLEVKNEIKLTIGQLSRWEELQPSLIANGILLYGKFTPETTAGKHQAFCIWENIKPNSKRVLFNKQLFGYKQNGKFYAGLLLKYGGERMGKGCIAVPLEQNIIFLKLFRKYKIKVKIKKVLDYSK